MRTVLMLVGTVDGKMSKVIFSLRGIFCVYRSRSITTAREQVALSMQDLDGSSIAFFVFLWLQVG